MYRFHALSHEGKSTTCRLLLFALPLPSLGVGGTFWGSNSLSNMTNLPRLMRSCKMDPARWILGSSSPESISWSCGGSACAFFGVSGSHWKNWMSERNSQEKRKRRRRKKLERTVVSTVPFPWKWPSEELVKGVCSLCLFLGCFEGGFSGASELSEPESFLWAIGSLASELSEV